ncbi:hypothetical protein KJN74_04970, partial [Candidatus Bathyarchaeota archaeon]|nr:hypothetical protein [Candidatus Bathyarchaeota archaeon]
MTNIAVIGSISHEAVENFDWTKPFGNLEKYDYLIIDLPSFPKDYPPFLFENIGLLKRTSRLFIRDNKEIFCILEKPFKILFKEIPLNYSWIPFPQKLTVNPMLLGKTIINKEERFAEYMKNVEKWDNELFWEKTTNITFKNIAVNKSQNPIAATVTIGNRGKIHFLPKPSRNNLDSIQLLVDIINRNETEENTSSSFLEKPEINEFEEFENINKINLKLYNNLFSKDVEKIL